MVAQYYLQHSRLLLGIHIERRHLADHCSDDAIINNNKRVARGELFFSIEFIDLVCHFTFEVTGLRNLVFCLAFFKRVHKLILYIYWYKIYKSLTG